MAKKSNNGQPSSTAPRIGTDSTGGILLKDFSVRKAVCGREELRVLAESSAPNPITLCMLCGVVTSVILGKGDLGVWARLCGQFVASVFQGPNAGRRVYASRGAYIPEPLATLIVNRVRAASEAAIGQDKGDVEPVPLAAPIDMKVGIAVKCDPDSATGYIYELQMPDDTIQEAINALPERMRQELLAWDGAAEV